MDPWTLNRFAGFTYHGYKIVVRKDAPRYMLPEELLPGLPWPPGFRETFNVWSVDYLGMRPNIIPDGQLKMLGQEVHMNPRTYELLVIQCRLTPTPETP